MSDIKFVRCPVVNGKAYASMDEFRKDAIEQIFVGVSGDGRLDQYELSEIGTIIVDNAADVIEILTLNTRSRPQMRKDRKARKPRKDATLPLPDNT